VTTGNPAATAAPRDHGHGHGNGHAAPPPAEVAAGTRLLTVEEARGRVLAAIAGPLPAEDVTIADALRRVLAKPVISATALPPWDNSAMDGYAVRAADTAGATEGEPRRLRVTGEVAAGEAAGTSFAAGTALRIATGAPLPPGADAVVPVEDTTPLAADGAVGRRGRDASGPLPDTVLIHVAAEVGGSVRRRGSDLLDGATILEPGTELSPAAIALAAGSGAGSVSVHRRPRIAVLATGDEVRAVGEALGPAGIPDANGPGLRALVRDFGAEPIDLGIGRDSLADIRARLARGIAEADVVIASGGVSVGPYDVVKIAFEEVGRLDLWRVAVQPGKPFAFGTAARPGAGHDDRPVLFFGLPGNPVSSFVTFELFVRPALRLLAGHRRLLPTDDAAVLTEPVSKSAGRRAYLRVQALRRPDGSVIRDDRGRVRVRLAGGQGSHVMSALAIADALAAIPEATDRLEAGSEVALWWLGRE
jgi:molybdopterin molybdotransferase